MSDAAGRQLYMPTRLELGATDAFAWASVREAPDAATGTGTAATAVAATVAAAAPSATTAGAVASAGAASFDASSRRLRNRRRLRGFRMGGGGFGGGGFSRGTGSFFSPRRGASQGPAAGGRGPVSAFGGGRGAPAPVGRPGAQYYTGTPFVGGGYVPTMGYHPSLGFDIATGVMLAHVLRQPHGRPAAAVLHTPHGAATAPGALPQLAAPPSREGSYYYAARALHAGSLLRVAPLAPAAAAALAAANPTERSTGQQAKRAVLRALNVSYDRFAIVEELRVPADAAWPLELSMSASRVHVPTHAAGAPHRKAGPPGSWPPPLYVGLQAASPARLRSTRLAQRASDALSHTAVVLLMALTALAVAGASRTSAWERETSLEASDSEAEPAEEARPMTNVPHGGPCVSADGEILAVGSRVQTQHTRARGGDDSWYAGAVLALHTDGRATIIYDDGVEEVAPLNEVYMLQGGDADEESARPQAQGTRQQPVPVAVGVPVRDRSL